MSITKARSKKAGKPTRRQAKRQKATAKRSKGVVTPVAASDAVRLRERLTLTQAQFAPMLAVSIRSLATLEAGTAPMEPVRRRLTELSRLTRALREVLDEKAIGMWLDTPNHAFQGLKPIEVIGRGETDRLWAMIYALRSGAAF